MDATYPPEWLCRALLDRTDAGIAFLDVDLRYVYVNDALARMNGLPAPAHVGRAIADVVPKVDAGEHVLREVLADGTPRVMVSSGQTRADSPHERRYWQGSYFRLEDETGKPRGLGAIVMEVSADRESQRELERARERLLLLDAAAVRIGTTLEMDQTCQELVDLLVEVIADAATVEVLSMSGGEGRRPPPHGTLRLRRAAMAARPAMRDKMRQFGVPGEHVDYQPGAAIPRCLETGRPVVSNLATDAELARAAPNVERVARYRAAGIHSAMTVPLAARGDQIGTVTLVRAGMSAAFDEEDIAVARALADRAALSLDNARRYTREHAIAVELQRALLAAPATESPHAGIDVATHYLPAGTSDLVGGDWFDTVALPDGTALLAMGDVMGHGVEAAVEMSHYRSMLRIACGEPGSPHELLRRMDALLCAVGSERPATCLLVFADPVRGRCWSANAGHLPPALVTTSGAVALLDVPPGPPLGADLGGGYETVPLAWGRGETLLLYTDGLVERRFEDIDASLARLAALRLPQASGPLDVLLARIVQRLAPASPEDDVALLAARQRTRTRPVDNSRQARRPSL
ncbi:SpoIIE family protein phosphatase [Streptomyces sp. HPF1205]|uniref:SpoIIE family protein phosphatase n=1 Tax=Streptomyces sp. HPF1205 TaxID=2873262 RepID=UPI001CECB94C|nr:SpoIIE family protein phosphatase [Streptomyces sp. HPF1205]